MSRLRVTTSARDDLRAVFHQGIDMFGLVQADAYVDGLFDLFDGIAVMPRSGRLIEYVQPPVRVLPFKAHVVVYEENADSVSILRIRSAREDWIPDPQGNS